MHEPQAGQRPSGVIIGTPTQLVPTLIICSDSSLTYLFVFLRQNAKLDRARRFRWCSF